MSTSGTEYAIFSREVEDPIGASGHSVARSCAKRDGDLCSTAPDWLSRSKFWNLFTQPTAQTGQVGRYNMPTLNHVPGPTHSANRASAMGNGQLYSQLGSAI